jgi:dTMP kinase
MIKNPYGGVFIGVDGPNGVGKSTIIKEMANQLISQGYKVSVTKEPSDTIIGNFVREVSETISGEALACLVAANRYEHLEEEIIPALNKNRIVISDRYVLSSFILQSLDNVDMEFIKKINDEIIIPDIQIVLLAEEQLIKSRLEARKILHRFEKNNQTSKEIGYTNEGIRYLQKLGFNIQIFDTGEDININVSRMVNIVKERVNSNIILG